jgi:hypothetical protein
MRLGIDDGGGRYHNSGSAAFGRKCAGMPPHSSHIRVDIAA